jgi:hypothetical protein
MAAIDQAQLLTDEKIWLPSNNVLTDELMAAINVGIVANQIPADDDIYYAEALCKGLKAMAHTNNSKWVVDVKGFKREKIGTGELEKYEAGYTNPWGAYIKSLKDICPLFGYTGLTLGIGMKINPGDKPCISNEALASDLIDVNLTCNTTSTDDDLKL